MLNRPRRLARRGIRSRREGRAWPVSVWRRCLRAEASTRSRKSLPLLALPPPFGIDGVAAGTGGARAVPFAPWRRIDPRLPAQQRQLRKGVLLRLRFEPLRQRMASRRRDIGAAGRSRRRRSDARLPLLGRIEGRVGPATGGRPPSFHRRSAERARVLASRAVASAARTAVRPAGRRHWNDGSDGGRGSRLAHPGNYGPYLPDELVCWLERRDRSASPDRRAASPARAKTRPQHRPQER